MSRPLARGDLDYRNRFHWQNSGMKDSYPELLIEYPPEGFESGSKTDESGWFARSPVPTMTLPFFIVSTLLPLPSPKLKPVGIGDLRFTARECQTQKTNERTAG